MRAPHAFFGLLMRFPFVSFLLLLTLFFGLIYILNDTRKPAEEEGVAIIENVIPVEIVRFSDQKQTVVYGSVDHQGTMTINAAASGFVYQLPVVEGERVEMGSRIAVLSETVSGANSALINKRIADQSLASQEEILRRNNKIIDNELDRYKAKNDRHSTARNQLKIDRENTLLSREQARLSQQQAAINLSRFYPTAPMAGVVEQVFVDTGDAVNIGTPLAVVRGVGNDVAIEANISQSVAEYIDAGQTARIILADGSEVRAIPSHVSQLPTKAEAYTIHFALEDEEQNFYDGMVVEIILPLTRAEGALIPLDAVQVSHDDAILFVVEDDRARSRNVILGDVIGGLVEVREGLSAGDLIILERTVVDGSAISIINE